MSGEERRGWHADAWNSGMGQNAAVNARLLQDSTPGYHPNDRSHSYAWAQREESLRQRELMKQQNNRQECPGVELQRNGYIGTEVYRQMPSAAYHRPLPTRGGQPQDLQQSQCHESVPQLQIVDRINPEAARLANDIAFNRSQTFHPYVENVFRNDGPYAVCNLTSEINREFLRMGVPLKFVSKPVGINDSGLVIDLIDNRNGRSKGTVFLR